MIRHLLFVTLLVLLTACEPDTVAVVTPDGSDPDTTEFAERFARSFEGSLAVNLTFFDAACECGDDEAEFCEGNQPGLLDEVSACIREVAEGAPPPPESMEDYLRCHESYHPLVFACANDIKTASETCESAADVELDCIEELQGPDSPIHDCDGLLTAPIRDWFHDANIGSCHP